MTGASGAKLSKHVHAISSVASLITVGGKKFPQNGPCAQSPPVVTLAPRTIASSTKAAAFLHAASLMRGPIVVRESSPCPRASVSASEVRRATKSSYTDSCTRNRFAATQVCPEFRNLASIAPLIAASMSASGMTMNGAFPPSSKEVRFTVAALLAASSVPIAVDPVKESLRMRVSPVKTSPAATTPSLDTGTTLSTPGGTPARLASSARARAENGVSSEGLMTQVHPAARAGAALRVIMASGKFQGVTSAHGPTGCFWTKRRRLGDVGGMMVPRTRVASAA
mmetsp:Transcript_29043/g.68618  ORF Transcript_29043/g.68618 Transcript_29043/m.68618 type:complete len:282 (-) Transcript_29043:135-980(-)